MTAEIIQLIGKYLIALGVLGGCFGLIAQGISGDVTQPWTIIGLVVGWIVRDSAGSAATTNAVKTIAAVTPAAPPAPAPAP